MTSEQANETDEPKKKVRRLKKTENRSFTTDQVSQIVEAVRKSGERVATTVEEQHGKTRETIEESSDDLLKEQIKTNGELVKLRVEITAKLEDIRSLQEQLLRAPGSTAISSSIDRLTEELGKKIESLSSEMDSVVGMGKKEEELMKFLKDNMDVNEALKDVFERYFEQMNSQIPEQLQNPTERRIKDELTDEEKKDLADGKKDWREMYREKVEEWFEERIRGMEEIELSFEEQQETYLILSRYVNNFVLSDEKDIEQLGKRLRTKLETRRVAHRVARVWNLAGPEQIVGEASRISHLILAEMFKEGGPMVQRELQNYERMGRILREKRDELRALLQARGAKKAETPREIELEDEIRAKELYILDYYKMGGSLEDKGMEDAYVGRNGRVQAKGVYNGKTGSEGNDNTEGFFYKLGTKGKEYTAEKRAQLIDANLKDPKLDRAKREKLKNEVWARKYAGKLWSITFRAAYHDVLLNGSGDFYAARIMNFADRLRENVLLRDSEDIWNPSSGGFKPYDIGFTDLITDLTGKIGKKPGSQGDLGKVGILTTDKNGRKVKDMRGMGLRTLENFEWCSDEDGKSILWDRVLAEPENKPKDAAVTVRMTYFIDADNTRKKNWGADSYFHKPSREGMVSMEGAHGHRGTSESEYEVMDKEGNPMLDKDGKQIVIKGISGIEYGWIDTIDRHCHWLTTDAGERVTGNPITGYAEKAEIRAAITTAVKNGMINGEIRDIFLKKYLGTKNDFLLNRMTEISVIWNDMKQNFGAANLTALGEFIKRLFGYVFSDEGIRV